jgi:hypothetical protein
VPGSTLDLFQFGVREDQLGCDIAKQWQSWHTLRAPKIAESMEVRQYVYATDTTKTTNSKLPWKNKTTVPKLCQIRDNLLANYMAATFPKKNWLEWDADKRDANTKQKRKAIEGYMRNVVAQPYFKDEAARLYLDYIDYGNAFCTVDWVDQRIEQPDKTQVGYVGPVLRRISPLDIVFNPIAPSFERSPKIVKSLVSMGEVKEILERLSTSENRQAYEELYDYMVQLRVNARSFTGDLKVENNYYNMDGFTSYHAYLQSDHVEILTFYGDIFDFEEKKFYRNHVVMVADRHKVLSKAPNPSYFGTAPIFHVGWRVRQDNLWAMGPLDNLVGMQYRIDHLENLKADCFDLIAFPPLKIKGYVQDFEWGPFCKIYCGDDSDVEILQVPFQVLQTNSEIQLLQDTMEMMAGSPKEAMGFRTPGEKTAYEVQRMENAAGRIFQAKIIQMEEMLERALNAMLELGRRNITSTTEIKVYDEEFKVSTFMDLDPVDLIGQGCIKPMAARHFAEKAERVQNLTAFFNSAIGQDPEVKSHFSSIRLARMMEELLDIQEYNLVLPFVRIAEQAEGQRIANAQIEAVLMEAGTPSGLNEGDSDQPVLPPETQVSGIQTPTIGTPVGPTNSMDQTPQSVGPQGY